MVNLQKEYAMSREGRSMTGYSASNHNCLSFFCCRQVQAERGGQHWPAGPIPSKYFLLWPICAAVDETTFSQPRRQSQQRSRRAEEQRGRGAENALRMSHNQLDAGILGPSCSLRKWCAAGSQTGHTHTHGKIGELVSQANSENTKRGRERKEGGERWGKKFACCVAGERDLERRFHCSWIPTSLGKGERGGGKGRRKNQGGQLRRVFGFISFLDFWCARDPVPQCDRISVVSLPTVWWVADCWMLQFEVSWV